MLTLKLPAGDICDDSERFVLTYNLECDEKQEKIVLLNEDDFDNDSCTNTIRMKTKYGKFIYQYKINFK